MAQNYNGSLSSYCLVFAYMTLVMQCTCFTICHAAKSNNNSNSISSNDVYSHEYDYLDEDDRMTLFTKYTGVNTTLLASIIISKDNILLSLSQSYPVSYTVHTIINSILTKYGVPSKSLLTTDEFVVAFLTMVVTLVLYYFIMGKKHLKKRRMLAADLKIAIEKVCQKMIMSPTVIYYITYYCMKSEK